MTKYFFYLTCIILYSIILKIGNVSGKKIKNIGSKEHRIIRLSVKLELGESYGCI